MKRFLYSILFTVSLIFAILFCGCNKISTPQSTPNTPQAEESVKIVYFSEGNYTINRFSTMTLNANYKGSETLVWRSSNESVAVVEEGVLLAVGVGTAEISVKVGEEEAKCTVAVRATTAYLSLRLSQTEIEVAQGKSKTTYASLVDNDGQAMDARFVTYSYEVADESVATVDETGTVQAVGLGETSVTVYATCAGETISETVRVIVKENINISFDKTLLSLYTNSLQNTVVNEETLQVFVYQNDALVDAPALSWSVADESVATVSQTGLATGVGRGETTITASYTTASGTVYSARILVQVSCPVVQAEENLSLEVYAESDAEIGVGEYGKYFARAIDEVEVMDDLGKKISASVEDGIVTIKNETLQYGERTLSITLNGEIVVSYQATVVTKYISSASELANFAVAYGGRDLTGSYSGWFVLTDNIDMTGTKVNYSFGTDGVWANNTERGFTGIFDGNGYGIYNLTNNLFGKVSETGVVKNLALYSAQPAEFALLSGVFAGTLENAYICADLSEVVQDYYTGVSFRTIGEPVLKNVVVEITNKRDTVKSTVIHDATNATTCINCYLISPSKSDPTTEKNNISVTHFSTDGEKEFNNLDKSSGYWKKTGDAYRFASCEYFEIERLQTPNKASFAVDGNGTLTWTGVENASGYTVLINGTQERVTEAEYSGITHGAVVQIMANGDGVSYRNSLYSEEFIYLEVEEGYLADFSVPAYEKFICAPTVSEYIIPASLGAKYEENITDKKGMIASNAIKVTSVTNNMGACFGDFVIKLPKATTQNAVTVRFMIERLDDGLGFRAMTADFSGGAVNGLENYEKGVWHTITYNYTAGVDFVGFRVCNKAGLTAIVYFDCVMDGNSVEQLENELMKGVLASLAQPLTGNYLADFSSASYASVFSTAGEPYPPTAIDTEFVENVADANGEVVKNALKVKINSPQVGAMSMAHFKLYLPKKMTSANYTLRLMVQPNEVSEKWWIRTLKTDGGDIHIGTPNTTGYSQQAGVWLTLVGVNAYTDYIYFRVGADDVTKIEYTIYFDCVMNGDCRQELKQEKWNEMANALPEGYLADFSSKAYADLLSWEGETFYPKNVKTECMTNLTDAQGNVAESALKITMDLTQVSTYVGAWFKLYLPKAMTKSTHEMRIMVEGESIPDGWWIRTMQVGGGDLHLGDSGDKTTDVWLTKSIKNVYGDYVSFFVSVGNTTTKQTITFYIDYVK